MQDRSHRRGPDERLEEWQARAMRRYSVSARTRWSEWQRTKMREWCQSKILGPSLMVEEQAARKNRLCPKSSRQPWGFVFLTPRRRGPEVLRRLGHPVAVRRREQRATEPKVG
eukprot:scaffold7100_cov95-Cylindrotheca_fusiformis.AAC.3